MTGMFFIYPANTNDVFRLNPQLLGVQAFTVLKPKEMCAVMMIADHYSPIRRYYLYEEGETYMRMQACMFVGYKIKRKGQVDEKDPLYKPSTMAKEIAHKANKAIEEAITVYRKIQKVDHLEKLESIYKKMVSFLDGPTEDYVFKDFEDWADRCDLIFQKNLIEKMEATITRIRTAAFKEMKKIDHKLVIAKEERTKMAIKTKQEMNTEVLALYEKYLLRMKIDNPESYYEDEGDEIIQVGAEEIDYNPLSDLKVPHEDHGKELPIESSLDDDEIEGQEEEYDPNE